MIVKDAMLKCLEGNKITCEGWELGYIYYDNGFRLTNGQSWNWPHINYKLYKEPLSRQEALMLLARGQILESCGRKYMLSPHFVLLMFHRGWEQAGWPEAPMYDTGETHNKPFIGVENDLHTP